MPNSALIRWAEATCGFQITGRVPGCSRRWHQMASATRAASSGDGTLSGKTGLGLAPGPNTV
jgi:hypothetical protein